MEDNHTRQLIKLYRRTGSSKALDVLVRNHQNALILAATSAPNNIMQFDDKVQHGNIILMKLIRKGGFDLRHKVKFNTFLIQTVKFRVIDEIRKLMRALPDRSVNDYDSTSSEDIVRSVEEAEMKQNLVNAIQDLPRTEQIIMGCMYLGMSQIEIAAQCGVTPGRITQIVNTSKKKLKKNLSQ